MSNQTDKCKNCGGQIESQTDGSVKCLYCGTEYKSADKSIATVGDSVNQPTIPEQPKDSGCIGIIIFLACVMLVIVAVVGVSHRDSTSSSSDIDSLNADTTILDTITKAEESKESITLKELTNISIDKITFKKLYRSARKEKDDFTNSRFIYDKTSPRYVNSKGFFIYIALSDGEPTLHMKMQYSSDDWLFINGAIINTDGENHSYSSLDFEQGSANGKIWEWYDMPLEYSFSTPVAISKAKKAKVRYTGKQFYDVVTITTNQRAAIKRQLQIFKGLLLHYDR